MSNPRVQKLADQIKVITAQMLERRIKDPRLGFVTVTDVRLTGDSREATIFYTVLGEQADLASSQVALDSAKGLIRSTIGKQLGLRFAPSLTFVPDAMPENARHIEELLASTRDHDAELAQRAAGAQYAGESDPYRHPDDEAGEVDDADDQR
ncbi:30S ribosome-binding factor RbfA [Enemella evansiae]|uniref:30S ribosome-binding factor RbfA n=1 Tax=Enemella evansiae TaxID=2016499 RepID=UPI00105D1A6A|nr:30S ribosome-binding factor RbfA [Enemella evansiae]TDO93560.1 ribosome-binding factor A [Enemella evansiae]